MEKSLKSLTDQNIGAACDAHGAKAVSDAAYRRMSGDRNALPAVGLQDPDSLADAHRVTAIAFSLMSPEERATDLAEASIDAAKIK